MNQTAVVRKTSTKKLVITGMLIAISILLDATPIGTIRLPIISATIAHIPTIIGGILCGPVVGAVVGLFFGLASLLRNVTQPTSILSFALMNPLVSVLPRILVGIFAYYGYYGMEKTVSYYNRINRFTILKVIFKTLKQGIKMIVPKSLHFILTFLKKSITISIGAAVGSITNTVGVLGMMYILYGGQVVEAFEKVGKAGSAKSILMGIAAANGLPEMIVSGILSVIIVKSLKKIYNV